LYFREGFFSLQGIKTKFFIRTVLNPVTTPPELLSTTFNEWELLSWKTVQISRHVNKTKPYAFAITIHNTNYSVLILLNSRLEWQVAAHAAHRHIPKPSTLLRHHPTYLFALWSRVLLEKLTGLQVPPSPGATQPIVGVYFPALYRALASSRTRLLDHKQRRATVGRTPLNE
jgi:hypothetical protein